MSIFVQSFTETVQKKNWKWLGGVPGLLTALSCFQSFVVLERWQYFAILGGSLVALFVLFYLW